MKIAVFVDVFPKISETFVLNQITGLIDEGHEVGIIARRHSGETFHHEEILKYKLLDITYYYGDKMPRMPQKRFRNPVAMMRVTWAYKNRYLRHILHILNIKKHGLHVKTFRDFYTNGAFIESGIEKYDIILCHFGPVGELGAVLKDNGIIKGKLVTVFHGVDISKYVKDKGALVYSRLFETGDLFLPISEKWRQELINLGCDPSRIVVHRMGIDTQKFAYKSRELRSDGTVQLLTIARLVEKKGIEYSIRAVAKLATSQPGLHYNIAGDGPMKHDLQALIKQLDMTQHINLVGWKTQKEIVELMEETDILVAPSVTATNGDQEGIPVVLMEALAQGIPVVTTHHSGIPELVHDGISGYLAPERDVSGLSDKLEKLLENPALWAKMGSEGRKIVEEKYDIHKLNSRLSEVFQRCYNSEESSISNA